jgi:hypothetical protein
MQQVPLIHRQRPMELYFATFQKTIIFTFIATRTANLTAEYSFHMFVSVGAGRLVKQNGSKHAQNNLLLYFVNKVLLSCCLSEIFYLCRIFWRLISYKLDYYFGISPLSWVLSKRVFFFPEIWSFPSGGREAIFLLSRTSQKELVSIIQFSGPD